MELLSVVGTDVTSFKRVELALNDLGLVWIGGVNKDTEAAASNGSGKSNLFKVISWTLYGETVDEEDGDKIIRRGAKCARGVMEMSDGEVAWRIERERRKGAPRLKLFRGGVAQEGGRVELQQRINALLGLDFQAFRNTALYGQRDLKRFVEPDVTDAERKDVLQRILRTSIYGTAHEWIKEQNLELKRRQAALAADIATHQARVDENDVDTLEAEATAWDEDRAERLAVARENARALTAEARALSVDLPDIEGIDARVASLRSRRATVARAAEGIEALDKEVSRLHTALIKSEVDARTAERDAQSLDERLTALEGESACPTCSSSLHEGEAHDYIAQMRVDFESKTDAWHVATEAASTARKALTDAQAKRDAARRAERQLRGIDDEIASTLDELNEARAHDHRVSNAVAAAHEAVGEVRAIIAESNPHTARLESARERVAELSALIETAQAELDDVTRHRAHYEFWLRGFGPTGLPSFALDKWMPYLTERANHYLEVLADGDITMTFATQRELKGGATRDEISIRWSVEGVEDYPPSGGQFKKMSVATDFALMDLACSREGASINLLCLDECLDGLDVEGRQRVLQLLHSLRSRRGTILVVSHETDVAEVFEKALTVTKEDGVSVLEVVS